jgi:nitrous oxidase accessory protein NosD
MARKRKSQVAKVRDFLFTGKKLTAKTAISRFGIYRLAAVIYVLRNTFNMNISTDNTKGYAVYSLTTS